MAEVESPPAPITTQERTPPRYSILDQVRKLVNRKPDLPTEDLGEYETDVSTMEPSMIKICKELRPEFEKGKYGLIMVDDTSGRLPGLAVKGVADFVSDTRHREHPALVFLQAGHRVRWDDVLNQFNERILSQKDRLNGKRILVVTEYIHTGDVINNIGKLMARNNLSFDIVTLDDYGDYTRRGLSLGNDVRFFKGISGEYRDGGPLFKRPDLTGLMPAYLDRPVEVLRGKDIPDKEWLKVPAARRDIKRLVNGTIRAIYG